MTIDSRLQGYNQTEMTYIDQKDIDNHNIKVSDEMDYEYTPVQLKEGDEEELSPVPYYRSQQRTGEGFLTKKNAHRPIIKEFMKTS